MTVGVFVYINVFVLFCVAHQNYDLICHFFVIDQTGIKRPQFVLYNM